MIVKKTSCQNIILAFKMTVLHGLFSAKPVKYYELKDEQTSFNQSSLIFLLYDLTCHYELVT